MLKIAAGSPAESQNESARKTTAEVLGWPGGTWLVAFGGVCAIGVGLYNGYRGISHSFVDKWDTAKMSSAARRWMARVGTVGLLARLVVFALIGAFAVKAAIQYEPSEAIGLDGALQNLRIRATGAGCSGSWPSACRVRDLLLRRRALPEGLTGPSFSPSVPGRKPR